MELRSKFLRSIGLCLAATLACTSCSSNSDGNSGQNQDPLLSCDPNYKPLRTQTSLAVDPLDDQIVYVGVEQNGFYKSVDGGASWSLKISGIPYREGQNGQRCFGEFYSTVIAPTDRNTICIAVNGSPGLVTHFNSKYEGVYCSNNAGDSWSHRVDSDMNTAVYAIAFNPFNSDILYAGVNGNPASHDGGPEELFNSIGTILKSADFGTSWTEQDTSFIEGQRIMRLIAHPTDPNTLWAAAFGLPSDGGSSYTSTQFGVFKTTDGGTTWVSKTSGMDNSQPGYMAISRIAVSTNNPNLLLAGTVEEKLYYSSDGGENWSSSNWGEIAIFSFDPTDLEGDRVFGMSLFSQNFYVSEDAGINWTVVGTLPAETADNPVRISEIAPSAQSANIIYASGTHGRVYKSIDGGANWTTILDEQRLVY